MSQATTTYAAVAAYLDDGVQILNVTNPSNITAAGRITDGDTLELRRCRWNRHIRVRQPAPTPSLQYIMMTASRSSTSPTRPESPSQDSVADGGRH